MLPASRLARLLSNPGLSKHGVLFALGPLVGLWSLSHCPSSPLAAWIAGSLAAIVLAVGYEVLTNGISGLLELRVKDDSPWAAASLTCFSMGFLFSAVELAGRLPASPGALGGTATLLYTSSAMVLWRRLAQKGLFPAEEAHPGGKSALEDRKLHRRACLACGALGVLCWVPILLSSLHVRGINGSERWILLLTTLLAIFFASSPGTFLLARKRWRSRAERFFGRSQRSVDLLLRELSRVETVLLEKSGVLTRGRPEITAIYPLQDGKTTEEVLHLAAIAEFKASHPIREAILNRYQPYSRTVPDVKGFRAHPAMGVRALYSGKELLFGNLRLFREAAWPEEKLHILEEKCREWSSGGETVLFAALGGETVGAVCLLETLRPEAEEALGNLRQLGLRTCLLSGDSPASMEALARKFGGLEIHAGLLPEEKARLIERERKEGNGAAMASPSQEAQKIDLQIGNHRLRENQLLDVPRAIVEARAALRGETMGFLLLGLYHVIALPLLAGAFSLSVGSESLPSLVSVLALAAVMGAFAPHLVWRATGGFSGPGTGSASR